MSSHCVLSTLLCLKGLTHVLVAWESQSGDVAKAAGPVPLATSCDFVTLLFSPPCPLLPQRSFSP